MDWVALSFAIVAAVLAGSAGVVAYRDRSRETKPGSGLFTIPERAARVAALAIGSAGCTALSAAAGAVTLILRA